MPTPTYDLIEEQVLGSAVSTVTFSSIASTYKDLVLECTLSYSTVATGGHGYPLLQVGNGSIDTGSNYSSTWIFGSGTTATSGRESSKVYFNTGADLTAANKMFTMYWSFMSYKDTNVNKTVLCRYGSADTNLTASVHLWRSTSAINTIKLYDFSGNTWNTGSTFRLWGVSG